MTYHRINQVELIRIDGLVWERNSRISVGMHSSGHSGQCFRGSHRQYWQMRVSRMVVLEESVGQSGGAIT
jgi:hypothetical protein